MGLFFVFHILYSLFFPLKCFVQMSYCFLVSFDFVSSFHFGHDVVEVDACVFPEDEEVVEEVARFGGDFFFVFVLVGDDDFAGFFSDFLVDFVAAFGKEVVRVGFGLGFFFLSLISSLRAWRMERVPFVSWFVNPSMPRKKQVQFPVWQAGPSGRTWATMVSSQSM